MFKAKELKREARSRMKESWGVCWKMSLVYYVLAVALPTVGLEMSFGFLKIGNTGWMAAILILSYPVLQLYRGVLFFGYQWWALRVHRREPVSVGTLMDGFSMVGPVFLLKFLIGLCMSCVFVVLGGIFMIGWAAVTIGSMHISWVSSTSDLPYLPWCCGSLGLG